MPMHLQGRPGCGLSLFVSVLTVVLLGATPASACPAGVKCISLSDRGTAQSVQVSGARFLTAPAPVAPSVTLSSAPPVTVAPIIGIGDRLERGRYNLLLGSDYHGLPPAPDGAVYYEVDGKVLIVEQASMKVIGDVTHMALRIY